MARSRSSRSFVSLVLVISLLIWSVISRMTWLDESIQVVVFMLYLSKLFQVCLE